MKAIVKATGETFDVYGVLNKTCDGYAIREVELLVDDKDSFQYDMTPAYWNKLFHQYAGMAMQGLMSYVEQITPKEGRSFCDEIVGISVKVAHALVEKMKNQSV